MNNILKQKESYLDVQAKYITITLICIFHVYKLKNIVL